MDHTITGQGKGRTREAHHTQELDKVRGSEKDILYWSGSGNNDGKCNHSTYRTRMAILSGYGGIT